MLVAVNGVIVSENSETPVKLDVLFMTADWTSFDQAPHMYMDYCGTLQLTVWL